MNLVSLGDGAVSRTSLSIGVNEHLNSVRGQVVIGAIQGNILLAILVTGYCNSTQVIAINYVQRTNLRDDAVAGGLVGYRSLLVECRSDLLGRSIGVVLNSSAVVYIGLSGKCRGRIVELVVRVSLYGNLRRTVPDGHGNVVVVAILNQRGVCGYEAVLNIAGARSCGGGTHNNNAYVSVNDAAVLLAVQSGRSRSQSSDVLPSAQCLAGDNLSVIAVARYYEDSSGICEAHGGSRRSGVISLAIINLSDVGQSAVVLGGIHNLQLVVAVGLGGEGVQGIYSSLNSSSGVLHILVAVAVQLIQLSNSDLLLSAVSEQSLNLLGASINASVLSVVSLSDQNNLVVGDSVVALLGVINEAVYYCQSEGVVQGVGVLDVSAGSLLVPGAVDLNIGALDRLNLAGYGLSLGDVVLAVLGSCLIDDSYIVVLLDAVSDVLVSILVGLAGGNGVGTSVGYLNNRRSKNGQYVVLVIVVVVNQREGSCGVLVLISSISQSNVLLNAVYSYQSGSCNVVLGAVELNLGSGLLLQVGGVASQNVVVVGSKYAVNLGLVAVLVQNLDNLTQQSGVVLSNLGKGYVSCIVVSSLGNASSVGGQNVYAQAVFLSGGLTVDRTPSVLDRPMYFSPTVLFGIPRALSSV